MWKKLFLVLLVLLTFQSLQACSSIQRPDLKSPCVGADGSPCGPKRRVNDWWLS
jgi:hypothetical protein